MDPNRKTVICIYNEPNPEYYTVPIVEGHYSISVDLECNYVFLTIHGFKATCGHKGCENILNRDEIKLLAESWKVVLEVDKYDFKRLSNYKIKDTEIIMKDKWESTILSCMTTDRIFGLGPCDIQDNDVSKTECICILFSP